MSRKCSAGVSFRGSEAFSGLILDHPLVYPWPSTTLLNRHCPPPPKPSPRISLASPPSSLPYPPSLPSHATSTSNSPANTGSSPPAPPSPTPSSNNYSTDSSMRVDLIDWFGARIGLIRGLKGLIRLVGRGWSFGGVRSMWRREVGGRRR